LINVIATVTAKPGRQTEVLRLFLENVPKVLAEDGCIEYGAVVDVDEGPGFQIKIGPD
jgi:quinol monooxygenase YgiN